MTREQLIEEALALYKIKNRLIAEWATGVGKSRLAIEIITSINMTLPTDKFPKVLLLVAETAHKQNWQDEFDKWSRGYLWHLMTVECYASLKNHKDETYDLIILDEGHHSTSDIRIDCLNTITSNGVLVLSATLNSDIKDNLQQIFGDFNYHSVTLKQATEWNILPVPQIYFIPLELDNTETTQTLVIEWGKSNLKQTVYCDMRSRWIYMKNRTTYPNMKLIIPCTELEKYQYLCEQFEYYKRLYFQTSTEIMKNKWLQIGSARKIFLGEMKTPFIHTLVEKLRKKHRRFICFCVSILQVDILGGKNAIHSKKRFNQEIIASFNNKEISNLFAVGMLQEGQNLVDIEAGIITQLDGTERPFIQKFGRTLRALSPKQFIFYYKNTRDEEFLNKILDEINMDYVTIVEDLKHLEV